MTTRSITTWALLLAGAGALSAQTAGTSGDQGAPPAATTSPPPASFDDAAASLQQQLEASVAELAELRASMAAEQVPLSRRLAELEAELSRVRSASQETARQLDTRTLDLGNLHAEIAAREQEAAYLSNMFGEYGRNFESRLHIAEVQRYRAVVDAARLAPENGNLEAQDVFATQTALLAAALGRAHEALGGCRFEGSAVDGSGRVRQGRFVLVGPGALFAAADGSSIGSAEQRLGSLEAAVIAFDDPVDAQAAAALVAGTGGRMPLDPTLGNAHKVEAIQETLWEHVQRGGPVMLPIFALAAAALLVALVKWVGLVFTRRPAPKRVRALLAAVARRDRQAALDEAAALRGPTGRMLVAGLEHIDQPRSLVEEIMYESVLSTRLRLNRWLPFIAITSSSAPLLGLLGTVTGIMNTFTLMTVFGTGDVKTLSSGISEALITTEFGLYVAIPSLLTYAFLSRKAKSVVDQMEKSAIALVNQLAKTPFSVEDGGPTEPGQTAAGERDPAPSARGVPARPATGGRHGAGAGDAPAHAAGAGDAPAHAAGADDESWEVVTVGAARGDASPARPSGKQAPPAKGARGRR